MTHHHWMEYALKLAQQAQDQGEVPVGAVLVLNDEVIGEGWNQPIGHNDPTAHAEIMALRSGAKNLHNYRLVDAILYVTLEPCLMCVGAMVHARIKSLIFGAHDPKTGAVESVEKGFDKPFLNHSVEYQGGVLGNECSHLLTSFFKSKR